MGRFHGGTVSTSFGPIVSTIVSWSGPIGSTGRGATPRSRVTTGRTEKLLASGKSGSSARSNSGASSGESSGGGSAVSDSTIWPGWVVSTIGPSMAASSDADRGGRVKPLRRMTWVISTRRTGASGTALPSPRSTVRLEKKFGGRAWASACTRGAGGAATAGAGKATEVGASSELPRRRESSSAARAGAPASLYAWPSNLSPRRCSGATASARRSSTYATRGLPSASSAAARSHRPSADAGENCSPCSATRRASAA